MEDAMYGFELKLLCGGYAYYSTYSQYVCFSKSNREIREASMVDRQRFVDSLYVMGQTTTIISNEKEYQSWLYLKGWALIHHELAQKVMPQWLKKKTCLTSPLGVFTDIELVSPSSVKRSYSQNRKKYIINRDGGACVLCGARESLTMQHILPYSKGGETSSRNMVTLCQECNQDLGVEHVIQLYGLAGLHHNYEPSLVKKDMDDEAFHKAVQFSNNLMLSRCEVW